jgi:hypothetical protein
VLVNIMNRQPDDPWYAGEEPPKIRDLLAAILIGFGVGISRLFTFHTRARKPRQFLPKGRGEWTDWIDPNPGRPVYRGGRRNFCEGPKASAQHTAQDSSTTRPFRGATKSAG